MTSDNKGKDEQTPLFVDDTKGIFPSRKYIIRNEETVWQAITDIIESPL